MRQPLERIPQLVLLTQELTKITPITHADHIPLQMALTQLECLSETLSEKKRDSLLKHKVRQLDNYCVGLQKVTLLQILQSFFYLLCEEESIGRRQQSAKCVEKSFIRSVTKTIMILNSTSDVYRIYGSTN